MRNMRNENEIERAGRAVYQSQIGERDRQKEKPGQAG